MNSSETASNPLIQRNIRVLAATAAVLGGAGLYVLGAQAFAVGLFTSPWDKLAHVLTFALIGGAFGLATGTRGWIRALCCLAGAVLAGIGDEWHQAYLPGRNASFMDLLADAAGGMLAAALLSLGHWLVQRRA